MKLLTSVSCSLQLYRLYFEFFVSRSPRTEGDLAWHMPNKEKLFYRRHGPTASAPFHDPDHLHQADYLLRISSGSDKISVLRLCDQAILDSGLPNGCLENIVTLFWASFDSFRDREISYGGLSMPGRV
jgi:hypothetical protein